MKNNHGKNRQVDDLLPVLVGQLERKRNHFYKEWKRVIPTGEMLSDRWKKAKFLKFGKGSSIYDSSLVLGEVKVGRQTWIGPNTILDGIGKITIGSHVSVSAGVQIYTHDSIQWALSGGKRKYDRASVTIGSSTYLGPNVVISRGVCIGHHCVVGAFSYVNDDIPNYSIVAGQPAKVIGKVVKDKKGRWIFIYDKS